MVVGAVSAVPVERYYLFHFLQRFKSTAVIATREAAVTTGECNSERNTMSSKRITMIV